MSNSSEKSAAEELAGLRAEVERLRGQLSQLGDLGGRIASSLDLPDGRSIPTLVNASPIYSADNEITGAIAVVQDMTPLEDMEKLRREFLGMVSHELRTPLTATEDKLLYELATNAGRVLTHDQILQRVWGPEYSGEAQLVRAFIRDLRRKLGDDALHPKYIFTEPQVGYRMAAR